MSIMSMRERGQGFGTKVIIGLIIIAFAFFGLGSITTFLTPVARVASVNGADVTASEMEVAVERNRRILMNQGMTPESLDEDELRANVLQSLIKRKLLSQVVDEMSLTASDVSLDQSLLQTEVFQVNGSFDSNQYRLMLASVGYDPMTYREELRLDEALGQLTEAIQDSSFMTDAEILRTTSLSRQTRDVTYITFNARDLEADLSIDPVSVQDFYDDNRDQYFTEEMIDVSYVQLAKSDLMNAVDVTPEALQAFYTDRIDLYTQDEQRRIAHVLIAVSEDQDRDAALAKILEIQSELEAGKAFSELAQSFSDDSGSAAAGGDLGIAQRDIFLAPFETAVFELASEGEISPPVETEFGFHLIQLSELVPAAVTAFDVVADAVEKAYREEAVKDAYVASMSELDEMAFEDSDLQGISDQLGLEIVELTGQARSANTGILSNATVKDAVFSPDLMIDGNNSAVIELNDGAAVVVRVTAYAESILKPFEAVTAEIEMTLRQIKATDLAQSLAAEVVEKLQAGEITRAVAEAYSVEWSVKTNMTRYQEDIPQALRTQAFALPKPTKNAKSIGIAALDDGDVAVVSVTNVRNPEDASIPGMENQVITQMLEDRLGGLEFERFQSSLQILGDIQGQNF
ncbi:MAG: SurA N-terminal domain-containing protein [Pseudomonadales bacterium]|nr:SurA N-terminal domain-containing protein [Pseudomonadales bacterium]